MTTLTDNIAAPAAELAPHAAGPDAPQENPAPELLKTLATGKLRQRRFDQIPLDGPDAACTAPQARLPGDTTAPSELADLISSISEIGLLQPILVEETPGDDGTSRRLVVAGERRLRACRWGAAHLPANPHFQAVPAIVCPGPLSDEERRIWQLIENLAREPLRPGEQAAALLLHRCAILTGKLLKAGKPIPGDVYDLADPVARFAALEKIRSGDPACAAPWAEVLTRLGLQLSPRKARELIRAFAALPRELSEDMDEAKVTLHTRIRFAQLRQGRATAADEIWSAVKHRKRADLLPAAVTASLDNQLITAEGAVEAAEKLQEDANQARSEKLSKNGHSASESEFVADRIARHVAETLANLNTELRTGRSLRRYDAGSIVLAIKETLRLLGTEPS